MALFITIIFQEVDDNKLYYQDLFSTMPHDHCFRCLNQ